MYHKTSKQIWNIVVVVVVVVLNLFCITLFTLPPTTAEVTQQNDVHYVTNSRNSNNNGELNGNASEAFDDSSPTCSTRGLPNNCPVNSITTTNDTSTSYSFREDGEDDDTKFCSLWKNEAGWVVSGKSYNRHEALVGAGHHDILIPWHQHSRRAFPLWLRTEYFLLGPRMNDYFFAPALTPGLTMDCHNRMANVQSNLSLFNTTDMFASVSAPTTTNTSSAPSFLSPLPFANRKIAPGDILLMSCAGSYQEPITERVEQFPNNNQLHGILYNREADCVNDFNLKVRPSPIHNNGLFYEGKTVFALFGETDTNDYDEIYTIPSGTVLAIGNVIHLHRSELRNPQTNMDELLLSYCFSHSNTSLLLLPFLPFVNAINHAPTSDKETLLLPVGATANVRVEIFVDEDYFKNKEDDDDDQDSYYDDEEDQDDDVERKLLKKFFRQPTDELFRAEQSNPLRIRYIVTRPIEMGDEILMDYGRSFEQALISYSAVKSNFHDYNHFRHEITVPDDFFPSRWLSNEQRIIEYPDWDLVQLSPGEIAPARLGNGRRVGGMIDRIGLPPHFADNMESWAKEMGLIEIMRNYILGGQTLGLNKQERFRVNGGVWWAKRFDSEWQSDMHYVTVDDDESQQQFMEALKLAGFDQVLHALGTKYNHTSLTCFYPSLIAVSHCTGSFMHYDSQSFGNYNLIFPILQANDPSNPDAPELTLGDDDASYYVPYKYERDHAVILGKLGLHGTAPIDYRALPNQYRIVMSIYIADFQDPEVLDDVISDWEDPPYPPEQIREEALISRQHWHATDKSRTLLTPFGEESETSVD